MSLSRYSAGNALYLGVRISRSFFSQQEIFWHSKNTWASKIYKSTFRILFGNIGALLLQLLRNGNQILLKNKAEYHYIPIATIYQNKIAEICTL